MEPGELLGEQLGETFVFKGTSLANYVVKRKFLLFEAGFSTQHENWQPNKEKDRKVWRLFPNCTLDPPNPQAILGERKYVRPSKALSFRAVKTIAHVDRKEVQLWSFRIAFHARRSSGAGDAQQELAVARHDLTIGFVTRDEAVAWHARVAEQIQQLQQPERPESNIISSSGGLVKEDGLAVTGTGIVANAGGMGARLLAPAPQCAKLYPSITKRWIPYKHSNGIAIYHHDRSRDTEKLAKGSLRPGGEYMVSASLRGSPDACLELLMDAANSNVSLLGPATSVDIVFSNEHVQVLRIVVEPPAGCYAMLLCRPRDFLIRVMPKRDEHNVITVLFVDITEEEVDEMMVADGQLPTCVAAAEQRARQPGAVIPVRGCASGGYNISALLHHTSDESPECLVTCILKVDLGGWCAEKSFFYGAARTSGLVSLLVDRMLMSVILMKDEMESRRFYVHPFKLLQDLENSADDNGFSVLPPAPPALLTLTRAASTGASSQQRLKRSSTAGMEPQQVGAAPASDSGNGPLLPQPQLLQGCCPRQYWLPLHEPGYPEVFKIRGARYLTDKHKVPAGTSSFRLCAVELASHPKVIDHISRFLPSVRHSDAPFSFIVNMIIPGSPVLYLAMVFRSDRHPDQLGPMPQSGEDHSWTPFDFSMYRFLHGTDEERNRTFKLIPRVAQGSWVIQQSVGTTPVIMGSKLQCVYHITDRYVEVDIDVTSSSVVRYVIKTVQPATKSLAVDLCFLLEGQVLDELPEQLIGAVRFNRIDMTEYSPLDTAKELNFVPPGPRARSSGGSNSSTRVHGVVSTRAAATREATLEQQDGQTPAGWADPKGVPVGGRARREAAEARAT